MSYVIYESWVIWHRAQVNLSSKPSSSRAGHLAWQYKWISTGDRDLCWIWDPPCPRLPRPPCRRALHHLLQVQVFSLLLLLFRRCTKHLFPFLFCQANFQQQLKRIQMDESKTQKYINCRTLSLKALYEFAENWLSSAKLFILPPEFSESLICAVALLGSGVRPGRGRSERALVAPPTTTTPAYPYLIWCMWQIWGMRIPGSKTKTAFSDISQIVPNTIFLWGWQVEAVCVKMVCLWNQTWQLNLNFFWKLNFLFNLKEAAGQLDFTDEK